MKYETVLESIDGFGKYQKWLVFLLVASAIPNGYFLMVSVFMFDTPPHRCFIPSLDGDADSNDTTVYNATVLDEFIPWEKDGDDFVRSSCRMYSTANDTKELNRSIVACQYGWKYEPIFGEYTAVMEWDIVCDHTWLKPLIISFLMGGILIGSLVSGIASDRFGRRPTFLWGTLLQFLSMFATGFLRSAWMMAIAMLVSGCTFLINYVSAFVIVTEVVDSSRRALVGTLEIGGYTIGYVMLPAFAYFLPQWRWLMWFMGATGLLYIPYYWWIDESPRWLIVNGKKEARDIIRKIAKTNGKMTDEIEILSVEDICLKDQLAEEDKNTFSYLDLFRQPSIRIRTFCMFYIWFTTSMMYFCLGLNTSNLGGNKFINCLLAAALEVPAYAVGYFLLQKIGRRSTLSSFLMIGGVTCCMAPFFQYGDGTGLVILAMVSKFAVTGVFALIYIYCCELYPTNMRNMSVGAASTMARVGAIVAPYLIYAGESVSTYIPYLLMGCITILSSILTLLLPETLPIPLPETMEDAIKQDRYKLRLCRPSASDDTVTVAEIKEKEATA